MEQNNTKPWQVVIGIIAVVVIGIIIWGMPKPSAEVPADVNVFENPDIKATQLCYIWNTEAGDSAKLSMDIRGEDVIGEFYWLPAERDSKTGIFQGKVTSAGPARTVNALWQASGEGVTNTEELIVRFDDSIAAVGFGEMIQASNGIWRYADTDAISYAPNLQRTDCGDEAMD